MARVDSASLMPIIPGLEDRIGNYRGWLTLSDYPMGDGSALRIAGYEFPFLRVDIHPTSPDGMCPCVVIDITNLDVPIELLEGETVEFA